MARMCLLPMRKAIMDALMFFLFASQMLHISGKLTVLRGSPKSNYYSTSRKLICISEDDGGALVWNDNLNWQYHSHNRQTDMQFYNLNGGVPDCEINCKMNANEDCLKSWIQQDWSLTNSFKTPMGPVFDQRWEEFSEYENFKDGYDYLNLKNTTAATLSISIRASHDAHILLCNSNNYKTDLCYWIIIGGWDNTMSVIRKCATGVPRPGTWDILDATCSKAQVSFEHNPLSEIEWRSFVIMWDSITHNITIYDTNNIIMTYIDTEMPERSGIDFHLFIRSEAKMLFRFHNYYFLHTIIEGTTLTSPIFQHDNEIICIQLLLGLCAECDAHIVLRDSTNYEVLKMVTVKGSSKIANYGLPMWQFVQIEKSFLPRTSYNVNSNNVTIQLIPKLNTPSSNPLWAIANVRQCPANGSMRWSVITHNTDYQYKFGHFWPTVLCQKLFYDDYVNVNSVSDARSDMELDDTDCPQGQIGPQCLISCQSHLESHIDCKETAICYKNGCTCPPGFLGSTCFDSCELNTYGHGCKKICGSCFEKSINYQKFCNKITGVCDDGCNDTNSLYIPPLCQINIERPNALVITSISTISIRAILPMTWKDEYKEATISYSFVIKDQRQYYVQQPWKKIVQNTTQLIGYFENLKPGITYDISCNLNIAGYEIYSDWQNVETDCNPAEGFDITSEETSVIIDWRINADLLYSCPANWYYLVIQNIDNDYQIFNKSVMYFPYELSSLVSYTSFIMTIFHRGHKLFSQQIRTLEGVPSRVLNLQTTFSSSTQLNLTWRPPDQPNGEIVRYEIILKVKEYYGCKDLNLDMPNKHIITKHIKDPTITISDLHSYTSYNIQVTAHNSRHSNIGEEICFDTASSEIPVEVFSHLRVQGWKLIWHPPEDCTMISGSLMARIVIRGISDAVKDFNITKETVYYSLDLDTIEPELHGVERYMATVYVIRNYSSPENVSAYQEYEFETPPRAPPKIVNLDVVEIDTHQTPAAIHLRWQSQLPSLNGKLRNYAIQLHHRSIEVQPHELCDLWDNYICTIIQKVSRISQEIQVFSYNMNVTEPSLPVFVTEEMLSNTTPDAPGNCTFTINNNSIVDLKWHHPWRTGGHLKSFRIQIVEISSNLRKEWSALQSSQSKMHEYPVTHYLRNYNERLYLLPSTQYIIHIQAVTIANKSSSIKYVEIRTPSTIAFDGDLEVVHKSNSTISLNIPPVFNDTHESRMHVIVKGPHPCEQYSEVPEDLRLHADVKIYDVAWQAAEVLTNEFAGKVFMVGDNRTYDSARNCPLKLEELYEIVIIVTEESSPRKPITLGSICIGEVPNYHQVWFILIILFLVVISASCFYFYYRRKRQKSSKQTNNEMVLFQNVENYARETMSATSEQNVSTACDRQSLKICPEASLIVIGTDEEERTMSPSI